MTESTTPNPLSGKRVLVVEDDAIIAECIRDTLTDADAKVAGLCDTIADALKAIKSKAIDIALVDVNLKGMRSLAVMQALRAKYIPFVAATAYQIAASLGGPTVILEKPYTPEGLRAAMEAALTTPQNAGEVGGEEGASPV